MGMTGRRRRAIVPMRRRNDRRPNHSHSNRTYGGGDAVRDPEDSALRDAHVLPRVRYEPSQVLVDRMGACHANHADLRPMRRIVRLQR